MNSSKFWREGDLYVETETCGHPAVTNHIWRLLYSSVKLVIQLEELDILFVVLFSYLYAMILFIFFPS